MQPSIGTLVGRCVLRPRISPCRCHSYRSSYPEDMPTGATLMMVSASNEADLTASVRYYLVRDTFGSSKFSIDSTTGTLRLDTQLDHEEYSKIVIPVVAETRTRNKIVTEVILEVDDVNDVVPVFVRDEYIVSVLDTTPISSTILTVLATDADSGDNGDVVYTLAISEDSVFFSVESGTGEIKTRDNLDFKDTYTLTVMACDKGLPPLNSNVTVEVHVQNTSLPYSDPPRFTQMAYEVKISEIGAIGKQVVRVRAIPTSGDTANTGSLQYSIIQGSTPGQNSPKCFEINSNTGDISRTSTLNYESTPIYYLFIKVRTTRLPVYVDYTQVVIELEDVNDNTPLFNPTKYSAELVENSPPHTYVTTVTAHDIDSGPNSQITYHISRNSRDDFTIDEKMGHIYSAREFDREIKHVYTIDVTATDSGWPEQKSGTRVIVSILDINDSPPMFRHDNIKVYIPEDAERGALVTTLTTIDEDEAQNAAVTYSFLSGDAELFLLDASTGLVRVNTDLDFETRQSYAIRVMATDGKFVDEATLTIQVVDVNDHAPVFERQQYSIRTTEDVAVGSPLLTLVATDADTGGDQDIVYNIENKNKSCPFHVDSQQGTLTISGPLDREKYPTCTLLVSATDGGGLQATTVVQISVSDINDNSPYCIPPYKGMVSENTRVGARVMWIEARDIDMGENARITYRLMNQEAVFAINETTGELTLLSTLDRETLDQYEVRIKITDNAPTNTKGAHCTYIIKVEDVNDNTPEFSQVTYTTGLSELADIGSPVIKLDANDADEGLNGAMDYSITGGNIPPAFDIHPRTGQITVISRLDYETKPGYTLTVHVTDRTEPYHEAVTTVRISISDGNDNPPVFDKAEYKVEMEEDTRLGTGLLQVSAVDSDKGSNGNVAYSISPEASDIFRVDENGNIILIRALDREANKEHVFKVIAQDGGSPALSRSALVTLTVLDVNDNPPLFGQYTYNISVTSDMGRTEIARFTVTDSDGPGNGAPFTFDIISGNEGSIFGLSGNTIVIEHVDKLVVDARFKLVVRVQDSGFPAMASTATVNVVVIPENNYPPTTTPLHIRISLLEDKVSSSHVLRYSASDPDPGTVLVYALVDGDGDFVMRPNGELTVTDYPSIGTHELKVSVSDGKFTEISTITIEVYSLSSPEALHPLTILLEAVPLDQFDREVFGGVLADILRTNPSDVTILGVALKSNKKRSAARVLDVTLIAKSTEGVYFSASEMKKMLSRDLALLQSRTGYILNSIDVDPCLREPCSEAATCSATTTYGLVDGEVTIFKSHICMCPAGFTGYRCDEKVLCEVHPCNTGKCTVQENNEVCECDADWTGLLCDIPVRHCLKNPCQNGGTCRDEAVGFTCYCNNGFKGATCEIKLIPDDLCIDSPCSKHSTCSSGAEDTTCTCTEGWAGKYCTYPDIPDNPDKCARNPCLHGGRCISSTNTHHCTCPAGYRGINCEDDINECTISPCVNGGVCTDGVDGYICTCKTGYAGTRCEHAAQPCDITPCRNGGFCHNINSEEYLCYCPRGYVGDVCETPVVRPNYCNPTPCHYAEFCTAGLVNYTCTCQPGWRGRNCDVEDSFAKGCDLNPCLNGGTCVAGANTYLSHVAYTCECEPGFKGIQCEENIKECETRPCKNGGVCVDKTNTYECLCKSGYTGRNCQIEHDPCLRLPCRNRGQCFRVGESYICQCSASFTGRDCEYHLSYCPEHHCRNTGQCGVHSDGSIRCACKTQFYGEYCEHVYKYCLSNPCKNGGKCIEDPDSYRCSCREGFTGPACQRLDISVLEGGFAAVPLQYPLQHNSLSLKIRTRSEDGLLLYIGRFGGGRDYLQLYLLSGRVHIKYCVGAEIAAFSLDNPVSDLKWHVITIVINSREISLVLDGCHDERNRPTECYKSQFATGRYSALNTDTPLYVGGADYPYSYLPEFRFNGCIRDIAIDGELLDLSQTVESDRTTFNCMETECLTACSGQERCTTTGGVVACQCPFGKTGSSCSLQPQSVTLDGSAYMWLTMRSYVNHVNMMFSLQLRTRIPNCFVYVFTSSESRDYVMLSLVAGQPRLLVSLGEATPTPVTLYGARVNDGKWHTILFTKIGDGFQLQLDGFQTAFNLSSSGLTEFNMRGNLILSLGDISPDVSLDHVMYSSGMVGCIRDVRLNNKEVNIMSDTGNSMITMTGKLYYGCKLPSTCLLNPCPLSHRCLDIWGDYECICPEDFTGPDCNCPAGYTGNTCQFQIDSCRADPCVHAARCIKLLNDYRCECLPGFAGKDCDVDINECKSVPCKNGGSCVDVINGFQCRCTARYVGDLCEIDTTPCKDSPCKHDGVCMEYGAGNFGCDCPPSWGGELCELPKSCDFDPCIHGKCKSGAPFVSCECEQTYTGPTCDLIDCLSCVNGVCDNEICTCFEGWYGPTCEDHNEKYTGDDPLNIWIIIIIVILSVLIMLSIVGVIIFKRKCMNNTKYNQVPKRDQPPPLPPLYPAQQPYQTYIPGHCTSPDQQMYSQNMFQYAHVPHSPNTLMQMQGLTLSTQTLDNEIKL